MAPIRKILVPVDLSPRSIGAARYAASLASELHSQLVFVHALRNGWPLSDGESDVRDVIAQVHGSAPSRFVIREGEPVRVILDAAKTEAVDLILVPARGLPVLSKVLGRSITARLLRAPDCPVWAGVNDLSPLARRPIRTIVCGLSLGPRTKSVLRWAGALAQRLRASLVLVHASRDFEPAVAQPGDGQWRLWRKASVQDEIRALQKDAGTDAAIWLAEGRPVAALPWIVRKLRADLLVIGKSPQRRLLSDLRTLSYDMVCRAPCPVASV